MRAQPLVRVVALACAAGGVFIAFAWPFAVNADPADTTLRLVARGVTIVLLLALAASAVLRARAARKVPGG